MRAVTPWVVPHGLVVRPDSDAEGYDRARDELAVPDPYATEWEPLPADHGIVRPPEGEETR